MNVEDLFEKIKNGECQLWEVEENEQVDKETLLKLYGMILNDKSDNVYLINAIAELESRKSN